jgi:hypothetical protein
MEIETGFFRPFPSIFNPTCRPKHLRRPARDVYKINIDGSYSPTDGGGGWGFVIRDSEGQVITAGAGRCDFLLDAFHSEVLAYKAGIQAARELGMAHIEAETDSLLLKNAMDSNSSALAPTGGLIHEIESLLSDSFLSWRSSWPVWMVG